MCYNSSTGRNELNKTAVIRARCKEEVKAALEAIAAQEQERPAEVLRSLVVREAKQRGLWSRQQAQQGG